MRKPRKRPPNVFSFREQKRGSVAGTKEMKESEAEVREVKKQECPAGPWKALHLLACKVEP